MKENPNFSKINMDKSKFTGTIPVPAKRNKNSWMIEFDRFSVQIAAFTVQIKFRSPGLWAVRRAAGRRSGAGAA